MSIKKILCIAVFASTSFLGYAQESQKLTGVIIGTEECVDYDNYNQLSYTVNTVANAFDGNLNNIFASYQRSGAWAGLDLGEKYVITQVAYCPRSGWAKRAQLGLFEGANNPDFGDAVPLFLIPDQPKEGVMTMQDVHCTRGFRYVRYVGPNDVRCNISELAFYGYPGEGDDTKIVQLTNLPTVTIQTVGSKDIVQKEVYLRGQITFISEDGTTVHTDSMQIRGRGNASWDFFPKKPYRFKLDKAHNVLGMPARKKRWTLINNHGDKTLMRNMLAFDLSRRLEMEYTPAGKMVDVILNGEYKGTYQLCDQIEVNDGRVEVEEMLPTDVELPRLSGGYLIEIDSYADKGTSWFQSATKRIPVTIKYPKDDEIVPKQKSYINAHFNKMESALFGSKYTDPLSGFRQYLDTESFIRHFLVGEISGNTDTYWSVYMYKHRDSDIFYTGPVWDFDLAYENDNRTYPINSTTNWIFSSKGSEANGMRSFVNRLLSDREFSSDLKTIYAHYRDNGNLDIDKLTEVIDMYAEQIMESQQLNFTRWDIMNQWVHQNPRIWGSYKAEVENVRDYLIQRIDWVDRKLSYKPSAISDNTLTSLRVWATAGELHLEQLLAPVTVTLFDLTGKVLCTLSLDADETISLTPGGYLVQVVNAEGTKEVTKCFVP